MTFSNVTGSQRMGTWLVSGRISQARNLYGAIGFVVVIIGWINLLARSMVLVNEFAVVAHRELWPRRIAQPPLTAADREVLVGLVRNELRRPEEHVVVRFDPTGGDDGHNGRGAADGDATDAQLVYRIDPDQPEHSGDAHDLGRAPD